MSLFRNIPKEYENGFKRLYSINNQSFEKLFGALTKSNICQNLEILISNVSKNAKLKSDLTKNILLSVASLFNVKDKYDVKSKEISQNISEILGKNRKVKQGKALRKNFEDRLNKLLDNEQLYLSYKIYALYLDHKNLYITSKILCDIRPVFTKPDISAKASIITNTLHIHYRTGDSENPHKDFLIALDLKDIQNLKKVILRAEQKNETLKEIIKSSGMAFVDPSEEN